MTNQSKRTQRQQDRDSKGRFLGFGYYEAQVRIKAENERAQKIVKVCDVLGIKAEELGVKQYESGNWRIDFLADIRLSSLTWGITVALQKKPKESRELLKTIADALGWLKDKAPEANSAKTKAPGARASA